MGLFSGFTLKVSKKELEEAAKDSSGLTAKYREHVGDPVRTALLEKDLKNYQEGRKSLKRKAEAKGWTPAKPGQRKPAASTEFSGTIGRFAKSGQ